MPAPGAPVLIRDEEWIVRSAKGVTRDVYYVSVTGTSEIVRGKEAKFLSDLDEIIELRPEETELVVDDSPRYRRSRLYLESLLRRTPPTDNAIYIGHRAAIQPAEYQLQPAAKALAQPRPRILMADGVGLGKTIEVGVLLSELIQRGRGDRILVVALKSILAQFQQELWSRFTIPLVRLDSVGIQRVQAKIPSNMNPFYYFDRVIISIDTLKKDEKYRRYLENSRWDVVVIDECQNVAERGKGAYSRSQRSRLAQLLARRSDALILTSATPHDGRAESFASLVNLLEPTAIANEKDYAADEVSDYFIRRFKKDVAWQTDSGFHERQLDLEKVSASPREDLVFEFLRDVDFRTIGRHRGGAGMLFKTLLLKAMLSSPAACLATARQRLKHDRLKDKNDPDAQHDISVLTELQSLLEAVEPDDFRKYQALLNRLRGFELDHPQATNRVVVFSERIDTLKWLQGHLKKDLKLADEQVPIFHGTLDDQRQQELVRSFGMQNSPIRILLASDAASEGINLHYYCHRMIHFDLPWSLITLEQRNGRIDRFGQEQTPELYYLLTVPNDPGIEGDLRVLERLIEKEDAAHKNLGDVAWLLNLHDAEAEEDHIAKGIETGQAAEEQIPEETEHTDFMDMLFGQEGQHEPAPTVRTPPRLFSDDLEYARAAIDEVVGNGGGAIQWLPNVDGFSLHPPDDLEKRFEYLPPELREDGKAIRLTTDRQRVMDALAEARQDDTRWPEWQLFWEQHPVAEWMADRVLSSAFGRHSAPVLRIAKGLDTAEAVFIFQGVVSNKRGQPVIVEWFGIPFQTDAPGDPMPAADLIRDAELGRGPSNPSGEFPDSSLAKLLSFREPAIKAAREYVLSQRNQRAAEIGAPLRESLRKLRRWLDDSMSQLSLDLGDDSPQAGLAAIRQRRLENRKAEIQALYDERHQWINDGVKTVDTPYLRIAAVLTPMDNRR